MINTAAHSLGVSRELDLTRPFTHARFDWAFRPCCPSECCVAAPWFESSLYSPLSKLAVLTAIDGTLFVL